MRKGIILATAALLTAPAAMQAQGTFCAPSDPAGFYACASLSVSYSAGDIVLSVQNLDSWDDIAMTSPALGYGWLLVSVGLTGDPTISSYLDGSLTVGTSGTVNEVGSPGGKWDYETDPSGNIVVEAGADLEKGQKGAIMGCQYAGSLQSYYQTCAPSYPGSVNFTFGATGLTQSVFDATTWTYSMRGIAGPEDVSFKCGTGDGDRDCRVVPEPMTVALLATGLFGVGAVAIRRRREEDEELL